MSKTDTAEPDDLTLSLTLTEVHALHKTIGIAIDNLNTKLARNPHGKIAEMVQADLRALVGVQLEVLTLLDEVS
jgi:hypothetical protein